MQEIRHSVCPLDCPDTCSMLVTVEDGRAVRLRGNPEHPVTRGFLCGKVARYLERQYSPHRLLWPQRRTGAKGEGRFERISWDDALDEIAARLRRIAAEFGPEAILPYSYAGTMGLLNGSGMDRRFFHRLGASRLDRTICSSAGMAGTIEALGLRYGTEPEQFRHAKLIIAWGANVLGTNAHLWPFIVEARRNGARFYTIDPRRNRTGAAADRHYFIHPGSDTTLALAMMHVIIAERLHDAAYIAQHTTGFDALAARVRNWTPACAAELTGIPAEDIVALAREYALTKPAVIRLNYGVQRSERGAMAVRTVSLLPVLTGAWQHPGGGLQLSTSQGFHLDRQGLERPDLQPRPARLVNMSRLGHALTELDAPPVKAMVVYNSNPAAIAPDQNTVLRGLGRDDLFTVVLEQFQTDTADYADILLPATTFLEHTDLYLAYGHYHLQLARLAVPPPGEAKSNQEVFRLLASCMGFTDPCFADSDDDMIRTTLASGHPHLAGITLERLDREHSVRLNLPSPFLPFAEDGFRTDFKAETLCYTPPVESRHGDGALRERYPLELISPKNDSSTNSTFGLREDADLQTSVLEMHPDDARARGIATGDPVRVFNNRGACFLRVQVNGAVRPGVVAAPSVRWPKLSPGRCGINALTSDRLTDAGGGPVFYSCLVEVEIDVTHGNAC
ncbi:MAG TPA: molybdopterin-dependent oxidoreductase [Bryobacteraceae bacterium]|nr:molybdopterin-dependent oxidoreductase [Bryobacteraceae bacterium]